MAQSDFVSVTVVTFNSGRFIKRCLESVLAQKYRLKEIIVVDNASTDGTIDILEQFEDRCRIFYNEENIGFAGAQNQAIRMSSGDWVLTLNPDVLLLPSFIQALVDAGQFDAEIGTVCGKLLTMTSHFEIPEKPVVDSTGIYFNPMLRHLDRGSQEVDNGHYLQYEYVFGATAAAALYRRAMIDDIALDGEFFDSDFFVYREDADVAWRAQLMGWKCLYAPYARGYHVRKVLPGNRRALPPEINMHSVKNRFLMRIKNISPDLYWRNWLSITARDLLVVMCCLLREHSSLRAFWFLSRNYRKVLGKRRLIQASRRVDHEYMASWFQYTPVSNRWGRPPGLPGAADREACATDVVRLALLGTRGIPANYGGFETFAEELSTRLAARGHEVTVYCRQPFGETRYRGVRLQHLGTIRHKYLDTIVHTFVSTLHLLAHRTDVALYCNGANAIFTPWPRLFGIPVALNVDGIERRRKKWNRVARAWYLVSEWLSTFCPTVAITDALAIQLYYRERYRKESVFIPYGAEVGKVSGRAVLARLGLEAGNYFLYVSRMEPENHPLEVRQAFEKVATPMKLALIGDAPYAQEYIRRVRDTLDPRLVIPGAIYGDDYHELGSHCIAYIHATTVGGTHPALIEAMGRGALVLYRNTPENAEVAGGVGIPFEAGDLADQLRLVLEMSEPEREALRQRAMDRVREHYSWDAVTDAYEKLLEGLIS